jgi:hypothetical protein
MPADGVRTGHNRSFGDALILDQRALQFERTQAIIGTLEDVVGAADIGEVTIGIAVRHVAGSVVTSGKRLRGALIVVHIANHQADGLGIGDDRDLAVIGLLALGIEQNHAVPRRGLAHGAGFDDLSGKIAQQQDVFRLAKTVADGDVPSRSHPLDHFRVERFAGAGQLFKLDRERLQILEDAQTPNRRWRTHRSDAAAGDYLEGPLGAEAVVVMHEDGGARVPRREEAAPGMLGPSRCADVQVDVVGPDANPVHGGEVADGIALVSMQHQLGQSSRARSEIQHERIGRVGLAVWSEVGALFVSLRVGYPAFFRSADEYASEIAAQAGKFFRQARESDHVPGLAAIEAVAQIGDRKQRGSGDNDGAQLESRQHDLPNRDQVGKLDDKAVTTADSLLAQEVRNLVGAP